MKPYPSSLSPGDSINNQLNYTGNKRYSPFQDVKSQRQKDHKLQFSNNHANSVNSSDLIFKARQIYEKYRHPQSKQTYSKHQNNYFPQLQPQIDSTQQQRHGKYFKLQNANTSSGSSLRQEEQRRQKQANHFKRQVVTASTVPSATSIQAKRPEKELQRFQDFLYMLVGVLSSHIRINQRFAFKRIAHYQISVKKNCQLIYKTDQFHKKRIRQVFILLRGFRKHTHTNMKKYPISKTSSNQQKTGGEINSRKSQNLILEQSTVEKGLKFLEDRANQRKKLQEMMMHKNAFLGQMRMGQFKNQEVHSDRLGSDMHIQNTQNLIRHNQTKQQVIEKNGLGEKKHSHQAAILANNQEDIYLRLERENKNNSQYKVASWINGRLLEEPFDMNNKRELFDRNEINQRRHYLNPCLLKQAEPDLNNQFFIFACAEDYQLRYQAQPGLESNKKLAERTNSDCNQKQHEGALPIFDPKSTSQSNNLEHHQNQIATWQKSKNQCTAHNKVAQTNSQYDSQQFQNLPSFNDQNRNIVKNQQNLVRIDNHQGERERRRSDLGGYNSKSRQSSFKISDQGEDFIDECQKKHNFKKANKVQQYFTENNVLSNNNLHLPLLAPLKNKLKRPSRPKSMTHSVNSYDNFIMSLQKNKPQKPRVPIIDANRPIIRISYESPRNQAQVLYETRNQYFESPRNLVQNIDYQSYQLRHPTLVPRQSSNSIIINKQVRAVSSEARFVGNANFQINKHAHTPQVVHFNANQISFQVYPPEAQQNRPCMVQSAYTSSSKNIIQNHSAMVQYGIQPKRSPTMTYSVPIIQQHPQHLQWYPHPQAETYSKQQIPSKKGISVSPRNREHGVFIQQHLGTYQDQDPANLQQKSPKAQKGGSKKKINVVAAEYF